MPELPDVEAYCTALRNTVQGQPLKKVRLLSPFLLRTVKPTFEDFEGKKLTGAERLGKRIVMRFGRDFYMVLHLMIAGRLRWKAPNFAPPKKRGLAAFDFETGTLVLTEAASKKRASLHLVKGKAALAEHDPGGLEVLTCSREEFQQALVDENHTLKRSLSDPRVFSGIGNAYSDEILHDAHLSPVLLTQRMSDEQIATLFASVKRVLIHWRDKFVLEAKTKFPDKVTAFRQEMAVHGKYGNPCPTCQDPVQRIVYASNETNYCATCQTGGKLLADRALSQLLKKDWPRSLQQLEERTQPRPQSE